jgi:hypothetical protein
MNISNYNQKLLAVLGTTALTALVVVIFVALSATFSSLFRSDYDSNQGVQIKTVVQTKDSVLIRTQHITFQTPTQLDTAVDTYLIPVGQVNLEDEETVEFESGRGFKFSGGNYKSYRGLSNNFILFENSSNSKTQIFKDKMAITNWARIKNKKQRTLLFKGTKTDSNNDKLINSKDYQSLFVFFMEDKTLSEVSFENKTVLEFDYLNKTDLISILVGVDINEDKKHDHKTEPKELITYDLKKRSYSALVPDKMKRELQQLLDK